MGGGSSPPPPPDPRLAIPDQEAANRRAYEQQIRDARPNTTDPFGGTNTWSQDAEGRWINTATLGAGQQDAYGRLLGLAGRGQDMSGFLRDRTPTYDATTRQRAEDALYGRATARLNPEWDERERQNRERLISQGFNVQDAGYRQAESDTGRARESAFADARNSAIAGGGQEASDELNRALASAEFGQQQDLANIDVRNADRTRMMRELESLLGYGGGGGGGSGGGVPGLGAVDYLGAGQQDYQNQLGAWNAQQGRRDARTGAIVSGAGTAAMIAIMI